MSMLFDCNIWRLGTSHPFVEDGWGADTINARVSGGGTVWPEVIPSHSSSLPVMLREDICEKWHDEGFTGMKLDPVRILEVRSKKLRDLSAPNYWALRATGKVLWQYMAYKRRGHAWYPVNGKLLSMEERARQPVLVNPGPDAVLYRRMPLPGSWDGSDFFNPPHGFAYSFYCTRDVVEEVRKLNLMSFVFAPLDAIGAPAMQNIKTMPWPPGPENYENKIGGGPPPCTEYPPSGKPVKSVVAEPLQPETPPSKGEVKAGVGFFGQPVVFDVDKEEARELAEFLKAFRKALPEPMKKAERYFQKEICKGRKPEIWMAKILLDEEETSPHRWEIQIEGDSGTDSAVQCWFLTIEGGKVVDHCGAD